MVSQASCPSTCPWFKSGCYAESGPQGIHTNRLNKSDVTNVNDIANLHASAIDSLSGKNDLRINIVGDLTTDSCVTVVADAITRYRLKSHRKYKVWAYTHAITKRSSWGKDVSVLRSCENLEQVAKAFNDDFAAAMVVDTYESTSAYTLTDKKGNSFVGIPCPATTKADISCKSCRLCMNEDKLKKLNRVILFAAHGTGKKKMLPVLNSNSSKPKTT
jgi:hypothetical protein